MLYVTLSIRQIKNNVCRDVLALRCLMTRVVEISLEGRNAVMTKVVETHLEGENALRDTSLPL